ncbi:hypothetical protein SAMN04487916_113117 [Arthrobacter sp. ov407]|uniref:hypothetical protein n=1 Tax=Arthrobacter sp. ov407 TaxID=1761748 RepID=UPI0008848C03|nr:hypothetical protein [Arthrobacter sp. ov407]SDL73510.1 hypothetical protein SAMN04487916_113117 [Arthrobacter sp. ov407]
MTDRRDSELPADKPATEEKPEERELRGRYVEGSYGKAGVQRGRHAEDEEGQYIGGDFGAAGSEGGLPEPLGGRAKESGRYVAGDYGDAGPAPGRTAGSEIGQYAEGDYGADGTVDPLRRAEAGTRNDQPMTGDPQGGQATASQAGHSSSGAGVPAHHSRSGADVGEAIDVAEAGTNAEGDHSSPERAKTGESPVEQVFNDPAMTGGQRTATGAAPPAGAVPPGPSPAEAGSGGAQSVVGARESDRLAAGEPPATGKPFETGTKEGQSGAPDES